MRRKQSSVTPGVWSGIKGCLCCTSSDFLLVLVLFVVTGEASLRATLLLPSVGFSSDSFVSFLCINISRYYRSYRLGSLSLTFILSSFDIS